MISLHGVELRACPCHLQVLRSQNQATSTTSTKCGKIRLPPHIKSFSLGVLCLAGASIATRISVLLVTLP